MFERFRVIRGGFEQNLISYIQVELGIVPGIFEDADEENNIFDGIFYPFVIVVGRNVIKGKFLARTVSFPFKMRATLIKPFHCKRLPPGAFRLRYALQCQPLAKPSYDRQTNSAAWFAGLLKLINLLTKVNKLKLKVYQL